MFSTQLITLWLPCYTLPPMQHHRFFRNLPPLFIWPVSLSYLLLNPSILTLSQYVFISTISSAFTEEFTIFYLQPYYTSINSILFFLAIFCFWPILKSIQLKEQNICSALVCDKAGFVAQGYGTTSSPASFVNARFIFLFKMCSLCRFLHLQLMYHF